MTGKRVLLIDNYDSFTWNLYQYLNQLRLCKDVQVFRNDEIEIPTIEQMNPDVIFISPGPGHPRTDLGICLDVIKHFAGVKPIFGVCMGLQCIFEVFGGEVSYAGEIVHGKTTTIHHDSKGMFNNIPQGVAVTRYHSLAGTIKSLPDCLQITASTDTDPKIIMGVRHKEYAIEGVQFHPESILTESGHIMIDNILSVDDGKWINAKSTKTNILTLIYDQRRDDYQVIESLPGKSYQDLKIYYNRRLAPEIINFYERLQTTNRNIILSEFKRASPSKGIINMNANSVLTALQYTKGGCSAISVLTEPTWFKGSLEDLTNIRKSVDGNDRPAILRKEFIFNKYQILESRLAGADSVLLIVKMLEPKVLQQLYDYCLSLKIIPLVEINNHEELKVAVSLKGSEPMVIGVNNRNLMTFDVDLNTTTNLIDDIRGFDKDIIILALSGINDPQDIKTYKKQGVDGFLIGESLMKAYDKGDGDDFLLQLLNA